MLDIFQIPQKFCERASFDQKTIFCHFFQFLVQIWSYFDQKRHFVTKIPKF